MLTELWPNFKLSSILLPEWPLENRDSIMVLHYSGNLKEFQISVLSLVLKTPTNLAPNCSLVLTFLDLVMPISASLFTLSLL